MVQQSTKLSPHVKSGTQLVTVQRHFPSGSVSLPVVSHEKSCTSAEVDVVDYLEALHFFFSPLLLNTGELTVSLPVWPDLK